MSQLMKKRFPSITSIDVESDGNTSFLRAARNGQLDKVLEHLKSNIDINTSNANGLNALHLASKDGHVDIVEELLKRGAVVDAATKKGNTALHIASLAGQEEVVKQLVQHGASVNVQSQNGFTPLYMAAQENHDNVVKYLLANGANQSLSTEDGFTPLAVAMQQGHDKVVTVLLENDTRGKIRLPALHIAAKKDDVKAAKLLLENEHNPDVTSKSGFTPLHIASHYGNQQIANLLIQKGADVNYAAKHNITPLHVAAKWGKTSMVTLLLEHGATIESKTRDGLTPLHCAARSGHEQVVGILLDQGAPISSKTKNGLAPLHMAAQGDHVDAARMLLSHRAPVDEVTVDYLTALHVAAHCGHVRVAKLLLDRQADANARALNGFTPLHIACKKNRIKVVELLLKHGASIGATTESGLTPLHVASFMGCMNIVIYLLQHDANPDVPTVRGETPLHLAARANQTDIIRILLRNGAQVDARAREQQTPLHIASRLGNVDIVMLLLQHGAKVDSATKDMYTALHIASKEAQDEVAAVLIDNGASLNSTTKKGFTPLHLAAKYGNLKVASLLLQKETQVDPQGKNGVTPLHVASHYDHQNVALLLLDKGASPHATAKNGHTPLHIAARKNQMDIANTLLEYGAQPNVESKAGFTPLHLSAQEGHADMTSLLIEHKADPNQQAKNGLTPMHLCAQEDRVPVAETLVKNGAPVDTATKAGYTPLHIASHYGQINMVRFLLSNGANVTSNTSLGYTPLHQAAQQGHTTIVNILLENHSDPNAVTANGQTPLNIAQKLGYITVIETLKVVTTTTTITNTTTTNIEEKYKVVAPEAMHETFMSDSEEEGGEDTVLGDQTYRYLTADEMKSLGDDSLPIDVTRDERIDSNRMVSSSDSYSLPPQNIEDNISPEHITQNYVEYIKKYQPANVDIARHPINIGFLVSFLVDARGGAMRGCRHSGVRVIVPPRCAPSPTRITCRYVRPQRTPHPPPLMEGEALASRVLELGPVGAKFLGPVIIEVPHFAALRGKEREIVILRSDNGESWKEHTVEATEEILNEVLHDSFDAEDLSQMEDVASGRITRILTQDFPQYFAVVSRVRQEVHAIGPEGGMVSSTVVPQVQAVFPEGALTKKIKVGLQAQPIDPELSAKLLGHGVAVSPVVTVEPRRRKFHKPITLSMPAPRAHSQGMINQYSGSTPTLRLLCSITGGTSRAQWEDVTGSTPLTFVNDCVSFTTTVSARFWLMDCRNIDDATKMATELYKEAIHVPFMAKFVVFAKRVDPLEARLRVFCMTDDKEDKTLEQQEHFTEVAKSRDVEVLEGKPQYIEFAGNLVPITKSGEQLQFSFRAFRENRLPFSVRVKDQHAEAVSRCLFMKESKVAKGEAPQQPICILNIVLPDHIVTDTISLTDSDSIKKQMFLSENFDYYRPDPRLADMSNLLGEDWVPLANQLGLTTSEINVIKSEYPDSVAKQAQSMLRMWLSQSGNKAQTNTLENALKRIGREDIIPQCLNVDHTGHTFTRIKQEEIGKYRLKKEGSLSKEIRQIDANDDDDDSKHIDINHKYLAEEKIVPEISDEEEDFNKTVTERRLQIEERLSAERTIPASSQRVEIVQEISTIKRQSIVEDKIAEVQQKVTELPASEIVDVKTTKPTDSTVPETKHKPKHKTAEDAELLDGVTQHFETKKPIPKLIAEEDADPKSPKFSKTPPPSPADFLVKEQAASAQELDAPRKQIQLVSPERSIVEEDAVQETTSAPLTTTASLTIDETKIVPQPKPRLTKTPDTQLDFAQTKEEIKSDKVISPVRDDLLDEDAESMETYSDKKKFWENVTKETAHKRMSLHEVSTTESEVVAKKRTSIHEITTMPPVPKPRSLQSSVSLPEEDESNEKMSVKDRAISFESTGSGDSSGLVHTDLTRISESDSSLHEEKIMTEYQASFMAPTNQKPKPIKQEVEIIKSELKREFEKTDSLDSDVAQKGSSLLCENSGYISDSEDVEQYISDSEIEDRVPQIRERQMSVFAPPVATRKTIYERSASLPTEDMYEVSARSIKLRKQYYEEQIKKEMIEEQLTSEVEDEASPERKALLLEEEKETPKTQFQSIQESFEDKISDLESEEEVVPEKQSVKDLAKGYEKQLGSVVAGQKIGQSPLELKGFVLDRKIVETKTEHQIKDIEDFMEMSRETHKPDDDVTHNTESQFSISPQTHSETHKEIEIDSEEKLFQSQRSVSSDRSDPNYIEDSLSKPDSMEVHVDKSEIEDSEKLAELDQDATDFETKSIDSEISPKTLFFSEEHIPEITVTLSEKQRRISEESDEYAEKETVQAITPVTEKSECESPINQPEEHIQDTVWEVSVQSQPEQEFLENVVEIIETKSATKHHEKEEDLSSSVREESDLGSEIHQDHSDSGASDKIKSESQNDIEKIILDSLYQQRVDPEEAKKIATALIGEIEAEVQKRESCILSGEDLAKPEQPKTQVSEYLRHLAETKGLDEREVELVESVLARRQRELAKLTRGDTQASSMEITDEDLRYSGGELDYTHILEQQIDQLEAEKVDDIHLEYDSIEQDAARQQFHDKTGFVNKMDEEHSEERRSSQDYESYDNSRVTSTKRDSQSKTSESMKAEKTVMESRDVIFEEDETVSESAIEETEKQITHVEEKIQDLSLIKSDKEYTAEKLEGKASTETTHKSEAVTKSTEVSAKDKLEEKLTTAVTEEDTSKFSLQFEADSKKIEKFDDTVKETQIKSETTFDELCKKEGEIKKEQISTSKKEDDGTEVQSTTAIDSIHSKVSQSSTTVNKSHEETTSVTSKVLTDVTAGDLEKFMLQEKLAGEKEFVIKSHEIIKRTSSSDSKSSLESAKSPEDQFSTCSSGRKGDSSEMYKSPEKEKVVFRKTKPEVDTSSSSSNMKQDRKSGVEFETYSSSGESHYQSFELDSAKSRPCSSDVEGLFAANSSEYESALTSQEVSGRSHISSTEYQTAVSSLSSKESMKSLDSESSGNLASIEVSEVSETLVPSTSDGEGDILDMVDNQLLEDVEHISWPAQKLPVRQSTDVSDELMVDENKSIDVSEEDNENVKGIDIQSKMKRSGEMIFQPEPKMLQDSPPTEGQDAEEKYGTSLDDGSVLSMSVSSTSSTGMVRTVIELSRADSERLEGSMTVSGTSEQLSIEDMDNFTRGSHESLTQTPTPIIATDMSTSTPHLPTDLPIDSVTITTSSIDENGIQSVSTQVTSETHSPVDEFAEATIKVEAEEPKKRGHRRQDSTSAFVPMFNIASTTTIRDVDMKLHSDLAESDKYQSKLSFKEVSSDEKKDVDESEKEESYETEADQGFHRDIREGRYLDTESDNDVENLDSSRPPSHLSKSDSERPASTGLSDSELAELALRSLDTNEDPDPIERPISPEPCDETKDDTPELSSEAQASVGELEQEYSAAVSRLPEVPHFEHRRSLTKDSPDFMHKEPLEKRDSHGKSSSTSSEKSSFEEAEAEAAFSMVAHISPAHKIKQICPILEDEDAEKHELETRERAQKEFEKRRSLIKDHSPGFIPDIKITEHLTPLVDSNFTYPDLELEAKEKEMEAQTPETPASNTSKSSEETDQGREYILEDNTNAINEEPSEPELDTTAMTESKSEIGTVVEATLREESDKGTDSPNSDSFEMLEKPDLIDDFVVIEEVAKEAHEFDAEGKSVKIEHGKRKKKHDEEVEEYLVKSAPTPLTKMTDIKYYPDGSSSDELGFEFEDSPPQANQKSKKDYGQEYDQELEANKQWIEQQFQGDQAAMIAAGYGYEMDFERGPLEDIKEEDINDFDPTSSRIGSLGSQKNSGGSLGSVKDSYSSTPEYDVLAGRKYFSKSGDHDDVSMSSLQEFESLEQAMSLEMKKYQQGSQDSSSNGSFKSRYLANKSAQGDDISVSSLKEFEGLENACLLAHKIEIKVKEEEALLAQIDEAPESLASESESCETVSAAEKKLTTESDEEDYEKRMFEIDEIIKQAQTNVERFIDLKEPEKTESLGRGDSIEEVSKVPDLDLDAPVKSTVKVQWKEGDDVMVTSTDSLDLKPEKRSQNDSTDSLDQKTGVDIMTASTDSIEFQAQKSNKDNIMTDSIEIRDEKSHIVSSDSLELCQATSSANVLLLSDSIDEDGSRIGVYDHSSSSTGKDFSSSVREDEARADLMQGSTESLDPTSSKGTHATYQYETDSIFSGSFTSGGSNTMVSSTDTIDPLHGREAVDVAAAVRKVWFDEDMSGKYMEDTKPYVTEIIEPCDEESFSHTVHRRVEMPPEVRKITFTGADAEERLKKYIQEFGEGEAVQETEEVDAAGNVHVKKVVQKRFVVDSGTEQPMSGLEIDEYFKQLNQQSVQGQGVITRTVTDGQGIKTTFTQQFDIPQSQLTTLTTSVAGEGTSATTQHQQEPRRSSGSGGKAPLTNRGQLQYEISVDDQTEVDPREHDWRFNLPEHAETEEGHGPAKSQEHLPPKSVSDQHQLSDEMKQLLQELEKESKQ